LADPAVFAAPLAPLRKTNGAVSSKPPTGGPKVVPACLSHYTHRVAISGHRLVSAGADTVAFRWKDDPIKRRDRMMVMRLTTHEFIRRVLIHVLPSGFHRIRHTGFLANGIGRDRVARIRGWLCAEPEPGQLPDETTNTEPDDLPVHKPCPKCGGAMITIEIFLRGQTPKCRALPGENAA